MDTRGRGGLPHKERPANERSACKLLETPKTHTGVCVSVRSGHGEPAAKHIRQMRKTSCFSLSSAVRALAAGSNWSADLPIFTRNKNSTWCRELAVHTRSVCSPRRRRGAAQGWVGSGSSSSTGRWRHLLLVGAVLPACAGCAFRWRQGPRQVTTPSRLVPGARNPVGSSGSR